MVMITNHPHFFFGFNIYSFIVHIIKPGRGINVCRYGKIENKNSPTFFAPDENTFNLYREKKMYIKPILCSCLVISA